MKTYFISGSPAEFSEAFAQEWLSNSGSETTINDIKLDINRTPFLGNAEERKLFVDLWLDPALSDYSHQPQGHMDAGYIPLLFTTTENNLLFKKEKESDNDYFQQKHHLRIAYRDKDGILSGLSLFFREDDPTQWIMGLVKNQNAPYEQREIHVVTSFDPVSYMNPEKKMPFIQKEFDETFHKIINYPALAAFIKAVMLPDNKINTQAHLIECILNKNSQLLIDRLQQSPLDIIGNPILQPLQQLKLTEILTEAQILACLNKDTDPDLYKRLSMFDTSTTPIFENFFAKLSHTIESFFQEKNPLVVCGLLLKLDSYGLREKADELFEDFEFASRLYKYAGTRERESFLKEALSDNDHLLSLKFLGCTDKFELFCDVILRNNNLWTPLSQLRDLTVWEFPQDNFSHDVACHLVLIFPEIPLTAIEKLITDLKQYPKISQIFDPITFADLIVHESKVEINLPVQDVLLACTTEEQANVCIKLTKEKVDLIPLKAELMDQFFAKGVSFLLACGITDWNLYSPIFKSLEPMVSKIPENNIDLRLKTYFQQVIPLFYQYQINLIDKRECLKKLDDYSKTLDVNPKSVTYNNAKLRCKEYILLPALEREMQILHITVNSPQKKYWLTNAIIFFEAKIKERNFDHITELGLRKEIYTGFADISPAGSLSLDAIKVEKAVAALLVISMQPTLSINQSPLNCFKTLLEHPGLAKALLVPEHQHALINVLQLNKYMASLVGDYCDANLGNMPPDFTFLTVGNEASRLYMKNRITAAKALKEISADQQQIDLILTRNTQGSLFYQAVREVEAGCNSIKKRLKRESPAKFETIAEVEKNYRLAMYTILYDQVLNPSRKEELKEKILEAEATFLQKLDVDQRPWARIALEVMVNAVTLLFCAIPNFINLYRTGNFLFYSRPESALALKEQDKHIVDLVAPSA